MAEDSDEDLSFLYTGPSASQYLQNKRQKVDAFSQEPEEGPLPGATQVNGVPQARGKQKGRLVQASEGPTSLKAPAQIANKKPGRQNDQPHSRFKCQICPFGETSMWATCPNCHCYVCGTPAPCVLWGNGSVPTDHCQAHENDSAWVAKHEAVKKEAAARDAAAKQAAGQGSGANVPQRQSSGPQQLPNNPAQSAAQPAAGQPQSNHNLPAQSHPQPSGASANSEAPSWVARGAAMLSGAAQNSVQALQAAASQIQAQDFDASAMTMGFSGAQMERLRNQVMAFRGLGELMRMRDPMTATQHPAAQQHPLPAQHQSMPPGAYIKPEHVKQEDVKPDLRRTPSGEEESTQFRPDGPPGPFQDADGDEYLQDNTPEEDASLLAVMEGLEHRDDPTEAELPPGSLKVTLYSYQKRALNWMKRREEATNVQGGILADEQGLGKTIQMLALIVSSPPDVDNATQALLNCKREENVVQYHALGTSARSQRAALEAARLNAGGDGLKPRLSDMTAALPYVRTESVSGGNKKARKQMLVYTPCGKGKHCRCMICNKANEQQKMAKLKEAKRQEKEKQEAKKRAKDAQKTGPVPPMGAAVVIEEPKTRAPTSPTVRSPDGGIAKRTLVVCPLCVASQWKDEVEAKAPQLSVALYHGPDRREKYNPSLLASHDVVITTYDILTHEKAESPVGPIFRVPWFRIILDEAHLVRNKSTMSAQACMALQGQRRWCLTGTPIVNTASDVYSLFCFLRYLPFSNIQIFNAQIRNKVHGIRGRRGPSQSTRTRGYQELKIAMSAVTLRRTKDEKVNGRPIIVLPAKVMQLAEKRMTPSESSFYQILESRSQDRFNEYVRDGWQQNYANILVLLLRLRQACIHPYLAQVKANEEAAVPQMDEELALPGPSAVIPIGMTPKLKQQLFRKLVAPDACECPICMDMAQDGMVSDCGHGPFCRECMTALLNNADQQGRQGSCPLCRRALTSAQVHGREYFEPPGERPKPQHTEDSSDDPTRAVDVNSSTKLQQLVGTLNSFREEDSTKASEAGGLTPTKTIVFSQFTKALDLVEHELTENGYRYMRLDGTMTLTQRSESVRTFGRDPSVQVLLCSIKAASLGLNLTMANKVILLDCWWNAATEEQAIDRCHRLGQTKEVGVVKLVIRLSDGSPTIEERIIQLQASKKAIAEAALGDGTTAAAGPSRLSLQELRTLFGLGKRGTHQSTIDSAVPTHSSQDLASEAARLMFPS